ncbi:MAG TPA: hypothetical protein VFG54_11210 [Prolixibacteraceae bacterium]|nr:hypothetical protein [Prolixibacteraceae bacterium]
MGNFRALVCILLLLSSLNSFSQLTSETNLGAGISLTKAQGNIDYWQEGRPIYFFVNAAKSWTNDEQVFSLRKEAGLNLQYANISHSAGSLGSFGEKTSTVVSLLLNASLQARYRLTPSLAAGLGPEAELLLLGYNNIGENYSNIYLPPRPSADHTSEKGINRNYFKKPAYGLKLSLFQGSLDAKTTLGVHFSYLWTKSEHSSFFASNYTRLSISIGFKKSSGEAVMEPVE